MATAAKEMDQESPKYSHQKSLGAGSYGVVWLAERRQKRGNVAVKYMVRGKELRDQNIDRELKILMKLTHPHIIALHQTFLTKRYLGIEMEFADGGDLLRMVEDLRSGISEEKVRPIMQQIVFALDYMHRIGVRNRDLKLENVLLMKGQKIVKLADFGLSKEYVPGLAWTGVGTNSYRAPETFLAIQGLNGTQADVWSAGVIMFLLLARQFPFEPECAESETARDIQTRSNIMKGLYTIPDGLRLSPECVKLLECMLKVDHRERYGIDDIYNDPWFSKDTRPGFVKELRAFNDDRVREYEASKTKMKQKMRNLDILAKTAAQVPKPQIRVLTLV